MQLAFSITTTTSYVVSTINHVVRSRESLTDYMVRYIVGFGITTITRYIASTMNHVVRSVESLSDCTVRYTVGF